MIVLHIGLKPQVAGGSARLNGMDGLFGRFGPIILVAALNSAGLKAEFHQWKAGEMVVGPACAACIEKFEAAPKKYLAKLPQFKDTVDE